MTVHTHSEVETLELGQRLARLLKDGDVICFEGPLGAGKTTLIRGILRGLGVDGAVRSPTFNLIQTFDTDPPVMHADLYRLRSADGIGLEEYFSTHICLIEWPDRLGPMLGGYQPWTVSIEFEDEDRRIEIVSPPGIEIGES